MRTRVKRARTALDSVKEAPEAIEPAVIAALRQLARAAQKGVIHKKTAARKISRLTKAANKAKPAIKAAIEAKSTAQPSTGKTGAKRPAAKKAASPKSDKK
jgi:small subunit ribosomal protein S20